MAASDTAHSIASAIREADNASRLLDDEVDLFAELFSFCVEFRQSPSHATELPIKLTKATIVESAAACRRAFARSDQGALLDLPENLAEALGIYVWRIPLTSCSGGYFASPFGCHIVVSNHSNIAPWMVCARQLGNLLCLDSNPKPATQFEAVRFDNASEKRTLNSTTNLFALELLMPPQAFVTALRTLRQKYRADDSYPVGDVELLWLSRFFGCSFFATGKRAEHIGLLPKGAAAALTANLHERGGPEAHARALGMPERPDKLFPSMPSSIVKIATDGVMRGHVDRARANKLFASLISEEQRSLH